MSNSDENIGPTKRGRGRPAYCPTDAERDKVRAWTAVGTPQAVQANLLKIDQDTLAKYYRTELDQGVDSANAMIGQTLWQKAIAGDTSSLIFWAKTRMRWSEVNRTEHTGKDGEPLALLGPDSAEVLAKALLLAKEAARAKPVAG